MALPTTEHELAVWLEEVIMLVVCDREDEVLRIESFAEAGLLTANEGLVLSFPGGVEFQLTVVRSR
jgi:hypothetical protein